MATVLVSINGRGYYARIKQETVKRVLAVAHLKNGRAVEKWFRKQYNTRHGVVSGCARWKVDYVLEA